MTSAEHPSIQTSSGESPSDPRPTTRQPVPADSPRRVTSFPAGVTHLVFTVFGIQSRKSEAKERERDALLALLSNSDGPARFERARFIDEHGFDCDLFFCYWVGRESFQRWQRNAEVCAWWRALSLDKNSEVGVWREVLSPFWDRFVHSTNMPEKAGAGHLLPLVRNEHYGYVGSGRDRYPASRYDNFETSIKETPPPVVHETKGKRIRVFTPDNMYFTREGQCWDHALDSHRALWLEKMQDVIQGWVVTLQQEPKVTGGLSIRPCREQDVETGGLLEKQSQIGFLLSRGLVEQAARTHPTHLLLLKTLRETFTSMSNTSNSKVHVWVEGHILKKNEVDAEYVNCHPLTGLLPYFESKEVDADRQVLFD